MTTAAWDVFMKIRNTSFVAMTYVLGLHSQQMQTSPGWWVWVSGRPQSRPKPPWPPWLGPLRARLTVLTPLRGAPGPPSLVISE